MLSLAFITLYIFIHISVSIPYPIPNNTFGSSRLLYDFISPALHTHAHTRSLSSLPLSPSLSPSPSLPLSSLFLSLSLSLSLSCLSLSLSLVRTVLSRGMSPYPYPLTRSHLALAEAQEVIDNIFGSHLDDKVAVVGKEDGTHQARKPSLTQDHPHPGRISHISELSGGGTFNSCYLLHFATRPSNAPSHLVLKIAPPPNVRLLRHESTPTPLLAIEAYLLNLFRNQQPPIPVPQVLAYDDTLTLSHRLDRKSVV